MLALVRFSVAISRWRASAAGLALAILVSGCSLLGNQPAMSLEVEARAVSATEYAFVPATVSAPPSTLISLTLVNSSDAPHTLVMLEPLARRTDAIVEPGERDMLSFTTPGVGAYRFVCTVHENMAGQLLVEEP